jgi:hypothetical protein
MQTVSKGICIASRCSVPAIAEPLKSSSPPAGSWLLPQPWPAAPLLAQGQEVGSVPSPAQNVSVQPWSV